MSTYEASLKQLYSIGQTSKIKFGLERCQKLLSLLNHPEKKFPSIHIAGSNGKGSVATKIAAALQLGGYRVGLFTSPHIASFRERIQINGELIQEDELTAILHSTFELAQSCTFFEIITACGFVYFAKKNVDVAVIETGLGGRLDATNLICPEISVITSISLEHTEFLGSTIEEIAIEKGGIIKPKVPVVVGPSYPVKTLKKIAEANKSPFFQVQMEKNESFEQENRAIAKETLKHIRFSLTSSQIEEGVSKLPPGRKERISVPSFPPLIFDGAHNLAALKRVLNELKEEGRPTVIFSLAKNRSPKPLLELLKTFCSKIIFPEIPHPKLSPAKTLHQQVFGSILARSASEALQIAKESDKPILIVGSFYQIAPIKKALGLRELADPVSLFDPFEKND